MTNLRNIQSKTWPIAHWFVGKLSSKRHCNRELGNSLDAYSAEQVLLNKHRSRVAELIPTVTENWNRDHNERGIIKSAIRKLTTAHIILLHVDWSANRLAAN